MGQIVEKMMLTFAESAHPAFRATGPLSRGVLQSKSGRKLSIHHCADSGTIETVLRTIISINQLSLHGAVAEMCEQCDSRHDRTSRFVVERQSNPSFVPSVIMTNMLLDDGWFCTRRKSVAKMSGTNWKSIRTRQNEQFLYWCRVLDHSWSETVFHDAWCFGRNSFSPTCSRSFRKQYCWPFITWTMCWPWTVYLYTFITLDVQSIYIPSLIQDWYPEVKFWANDKKYTLC